MRSDVSAWRLLFSHKTQRVPVSKINEAFARLESGKAGNRGVRGADF